MFVEIGLDMLYPQITKVIVNEVFVNGEMERLTMLLGAIVLCGVGRAVFGYIKEFTFVATTKITCIRTVNLDTNTSTPSHNVKIEIYKI